MKKKLAAGLAAGALLVGVTYGMASAATVTMRGNFVLTAVKDDGTLGVGGNTSPGLVYNSAGTGFSPLPPDDYLTPGEPFEGFSVQTSQTGTYHNNNEWGTADMSGTATDLSDSSSYDHFVNWASANDYFRISTNTFFNDGDERVSFSTTITAFQDLTEVSFLRVIDPDPDVYTYGSYDTTNGRGYDANIDGDFTDPGDIPPENWVHSAGESTGLTLSLFSNSSVIHNTGISGGWSTDPSFYLAGNNDGNGDYTIGIAFSIGELATNSSTTFDYAYVMGDSLEDTSGNTAPVPVPATMLLFGTGIAGLAGTRIRRKKN